VKDQERWKIHAVYDQRLEMFEKSRLRFKIERSLVKYFMRFFHVTGTWKSTEKRRANIG
jgi:hypothetical protein